MCRELDKESIEIAKGALLCLVEEAGALGTHLREADEARGKNEAAVTMCLDDAEMVLGTIEALASRTAAEMAKRTREGAE
jgi:hypothetical protein